MYFQKENDIFHLILRSLIDRKLIFFSPTFIQQDMNVKSENYMNDNDNDDNLLTLIDEYLVDLFDYSPQN